ncbi:MAG: carcinine hydrolase/isopenicillin-N N-acyltransferase family protein, partial [Acutalibacteraceae bacterium]
MCDTVYLKRERRAFFGKNSDRSPNEAHLMLRVPAREYAEGEMLRATYISVPQVRHTYACVLLKPHWIWGAEMGWNEFGLNIGNEAVFTREKREKQDGLIGMDLLRLALERCRSAKEALK